MKTVIKPESINILCGTPENNDNTDKNLNFENKKTKKSKWNKFKAGVNEVCMVIQPIINIIIPVSQAVSMILRACASYYKYSKKHGGRKCATC